MAEHYYPNPRTIQIGNVDVVIEVKRGSHALKRDLKNFFSNYALERETGMFEGIDIPAGSIESLAIRRCLKSLTVAGQQVSFNTPDPIDSFPDIGLGDEEGEPDLLLEVNKSVVDFNRYLAQTYPFNMVFSQYLALVKNDKREYEEKQAERTGATADTTNDGEDTENPTPSEPDMPIATRISGSDIS